MARRRNDNTEYYFYHPQAQPQGETWNKHDGDDVTRRLVVTKIYSFSTYNSVNVQRREGNTWINVYDDGPAAKVVHTYPRDGETRFKLPVRMVDEALAEALKGVPCGGGLKRGFGLMAANRVFYVSTAHVAKAIRQLEDAGWTVLDKTVQVAHIEAATQEAEEVAKEAEALADVARGLVEGELSPEVLDRLDALVREATTVLLSAVAAKGKARRLGDLLQEEPERSADKARATALTTMAKAAADQAAAMLERVKKARDVGQEAYAQGLLRARGLGAKTSPTPPTNAAVEEAVDNTATPEQAAMFDVLEVLLGRLYSDAVFSRNGVLRVQQGTAVIEFGKNIVAKEQS